MTFIINILKVSFIGSNECSSTGNVIFSNLITNCEWRYLSSLISILGLLSKTDSVRLGYLRGLSFEQLIKNKKTSKKENSLALLYFFKDEYKIKEAKLLFLKLRLGLKSKLSKLRSSKNSPFSSRFIYDASPLENCLFFRNVDSRQEKRNLRLHSEFKNFF